MAEHETTLEESETSVSTETEAADTPAPEQDTQEIALSLWDQVAGFAEGLMRPWNAYQILIAIAILAISFGLSRIFSPRLHEWMRTREGWPKWRYRYMLLLQRRMALIFFVVLIWITVFVMREVTWPSRSYLLGIFANLSAAWLIIALITAGGAVITSAPIRALSQAWFTVRIEAARIWVSKP